MATTAVTAVRPPNKATARALARRHRVKMLLARSFSAPEIAKAISAPLRTIERDIAAIKDELAAEMDSLTAREMGARVARDYYARVRELWVLFMAEKSARLKMDLMKEIRAHQESELKALQSLGIVYVAPEEHRLEMRGIMLLKRLPPTTLGELARLTDLQDVRRLLTAHVGAEDAEVIIQSTLPSGNGQE